jgi:Arc/MetJ-type ribon-helix-helix transcriptional regulator
MKKVTLYSDPDLLRQVEETAWDMRRRGQFTTLSSLMRTGWRLLLEMPQDQREEVHAKFGQVPEGPSGTTLST